MANKPKQLLTIQHSLKHADRWLSSSSHSFMQRSFAMGAWSMVKANYGGVLKYRLVDSGTGEVIDTWDSPNVGVGLPDIAERERKNLLKIIEQRSEIVKAEDGYKYFAPKDGHLLSVHQLSWIADELDRRNKDWDNEINNL